MTTTGSWIARDACERDDCTMRPYQHRHLADGTAEPAVADPEMSEAIARATTPGDDRGHELAEIADQLQYGLGMFAHDDPRGGERAIRDAMTALRALAAPAETAVPTGSLLDAIGNAVYEAGVGRSGPDPTWHGVATAAERAARAWFARRAAPPAPEGEAGSAAAMCAEFHAVLGQTFGDGGEPRDLRARLHREETRELVTELECNGDRAGIARELADVVYLAYGTAFSEGIDLDAVLREVHRANMDKRGSSGRFTLRADGKVMKPVDWTPPDVAAVLDATPAPAGPQAEGAGETAFANETGQPYCGGCGEDDGHAPGCPVLRERYADIAPSDAGGDAASGDVGK